MSAENKFDVIIVGAGPAGCTAAFNLAKEGHRVAILEKSDSLKEKPCGGMLSDRILSRFPYLKSDIERLVSNVIYKTGLYAPSLNLVNVRLEKPMTHMIKRDDFDSMLARKCRETGVAILERSEVNKVSIEQNEVEIFTQCGEKFTGKLIIGADGINSTIRKEIGLSWARKDITTCIVKEIEMAEYDIDQDKILIFFGFDKAPGYGWVFPKGKRLNIGIGVWAAWHDDKRSIKDIYYKFIDELKVRNIIPSSYMADGFSAWSIPVGGPIKKTYTDRVVLCGDAAGFVQPYTGEGIYYSMVSGEIAAKTISGALKENDFGENRLAQYQDNWQKEIGQELDKSLMISNLLFKNPRRVERVIKIAKKDSVMAKALAEYSLGEIDYKTLRRHALLRLIPAYIGLKIKEIF